VTQRAVHAVGQAGREPVVVSTDCCITANVLLCTALCCCVLLCADAAEVLAGRRSAGQRTHELTDGAVATLDSPGTRVWMQVLGEVIRKYGYICRLPGG